MKQKLLAIFAVLALLSSITSIGVYAEEEEDEEEEDDRFGFGIQEREREHSEEGSSQFSDAILYVTIGAIVTAIGYTVFKIMRSKKATAKLR